MKRHMDFLWLLQRAMLGFGFLWLGQVVSAQESRPDDGQEIQVLASGPVHEAFAEPIVFDAKPGVIVPKAAPELIEELPPDQKPAGGNVVWIPGYWHWDETRDDYLWVSGFWRTLPPGREWVPGYWAEIVGGWQWVSGYWANAEDDGTEYLPKPPQALEVGPSTEPPSMNHVWVPGTWYWREARYVWRPGYWIESQPNWIWSPAHYVWTPRGFIFVGGYWDYGLPRRGMLFAPVYFNSPFYARPGYFYTPSMVVNLTILTDHFFVGVGQRHYYFGDYYDSGYYDRGFFHLWGSGSRFGYDPIYTHHRHHHGRRDRDWDDRVRRDYERRRDNEDDRPARIASLNPRIQRAGGEAMLVQSLAQVAAAPETRGTLETLPKSRRTEVAKVAQETRAFTNARMKTETDPSAPSSLTAQPEVKPTEIQPDQPAKPKAEAGKEQRSSTVKRAKSPIADAPKTGAANKEAVPAVPKTSQPDLKTQPKVPGAQPPAEPKVAPKAAPKVPAPKAEPKPSIKETPPRAEPKPAAPKVRPEVPRTEPPPKVRPEVPKPQPPPRTQPEVPKVQPAPPKIQPEAPRQPSPPRVEPKAPKLPSPGGGEKPREPKAPKPEK